MTSYPHRTSPVLRGKWILENLLGTPPPPPPPNVPPLDEKQGAADVRSMRERMGQHRANPVCASLPRDDGSAGLRARELRRGRTLADASTTATARSTPPERCPTAPVRRCGRAPAGAAQPVRSSSSATLTEKLLTYALGRGLEYYDAPAVRAIVRDARAQTTIAFPPSSWASSTALPFQMQGDRTMIITKMALPRRTFLRGLGVDAGAAVAGRDGAGAFGRRRRRQAGPPAGVRLRAERHGHQLGGQLLEAEG